MIGDIVYKLSTEVDKQLEKKIGKWALEAPWNILK